MSDINEVEEVMRLCNELIGDKVVTKDQVALIVLAVIEAMRKKDTT